jgi:lysophospholipase L1-like esterase
MTEIAKLPIQDIKTDSVARVLLFGASIAQGLHDIEGGGYAQRLRRHYDTLSMANPDVQQPTVFPSLGIMGDTTSSLLSRFESEALVRQNEAERTIIIFNIGTNNSAVHANGQGKSSPNEYAKDLDSLFRRAKKIADFIMSVGLTPVDEARTSPVPWDPDTSYVNERVKLFNDVMAVESEIIGVLHVPVFDEIRACANRGEKMFTQRDGLHPNSAAHQLIADLIIPKLDRLVNS